MSPRGRLGFVLALLAGLGALGAAADPSSGPGRAVELSSEERSWLAAHGPLRFAPDPAFPPIEWFDEQGRYRGMVADYFELIEKRLRVPIEIVRVATWDEALRRARTREVDGITAAQRTEERAAYLDWTPPMLDIANVVIVRAGATGVLTLEGLAGQRVAVTQGNALHEFLRTTYPLLQLVPRPDDLTCLEDVSFGREGAAVVNLAVASYLIEQHGITNLRVASDSGRKNPLSIATRNDQPLLKSIMAKGLAAVTPEERDAIRSRWLGIHGGSFVTARELLAWGGGVAGLAAALLLLAAAWNRALRRKVAKATAALRAELSERQRVEGALRSSERKLAAHLDQTLVGVIEFDLEFKVVYWNTAAERILGWPQGEALGQSGDVLIPPSVRPVVSEVWQALLGGRGGTRNVNANLTRDGRTITCEWFNTALVDDAGRATGVMSLVLDVSERERREEEQARVQRLESLAVLAGGIAHDFNNLLTGIMGNISLVLIDDPPAEERLDLLKEAEAAAVRTQALTKQLLTFSRGGAPVKTVLDLVPVVRDAAIFASRGASSKCTFDFPPGLWPVEADPGQVGQVVQNLVLNAVEAMLGGGTIGVALANVPLGRGAGVLAEGPYVRLRIADHGAGIPAELRARIFDPFFSTKGRGTGLGLAVTHSIVVKHGGHIEVRSEPSEGTVFDVFFPATPGLVIHASAAAAPEGRIDARVLLLDDQASIRAIADKVLSSVGCEVTQARSGEEAIERFREARAATRPFDLVVLDLTIPGGMGGVETLSRLRELDPAVRAIATSGHASAPVMAEFRAHGFEAVLAKPWSAAELRKTVAAALLSAPPRAS